MKRIAVLLLLLVPAGLVAQRADAPVGASVGGKISPAGKEIQCDLPDDLQKKNISSKGQGCCTHRSVGNAALYQNVPALIDFAEWVQSKGLPGGGWPKGMSERITLICKDRGVPEPAYIQTESDDLDIIKLALKCGRMVCCTYDRSPTGRYGGGKIAHMLNVIFMDDQHACIADNNYTTSAQYEWMTVAEFRKASSAPRWVFILLEGSGPPAPPKNRK